MDVVYTNGDRAVPVRYGRYSSVGGVGIRRDFRKVVRIAAGFAGSPSRPDQADEKVAVVVLSRYVIWILYFHRRYRQLIFLTYSFMSCSKSFRTPVDMWFTYVRNLLNLCLSLLFHGLPFMLPICGILFLYLIFIRIKTA